MSIKYEIGMNPNSRNGFKKGHKSYSYKGMNKGNKFHSGHKNSEETKRRLSKIHINNWKTGKEKLNKGNFIKGHIPWNKGKIGIMPDNAGFQKRDKNPMWNKGSSFELYPPEFNKILKNLIKQRDNFTCQQCGKSKCDFDIHHIDYNKQNNSLRNLITLCSSCHIRTNHKREIWKNHFQSIMEVAN